MKTLSIVAACVAMILALPFDTAAQGVPRNTSCQRNGPESCHWAFSTEYDKSLRLTRLKQRKQLKGGDFGGTRITNEAGAFSGATFNDNSAFTCGNCITVDGDGNDIGAVQSNDDTALGAEVNTSDGGDVISNDQLSGGSPSKTRKGEE